MCTAVNPHLTIKRAWFSTLIDRFSVESWLLSILFLTYILSIGADRRQDEELDELSLSVQRIGGVGLTIHEELLAQVDLTFDMFFGL